MPLACLSPSYQQFCPIAALDAGSLGDDTGVGMGRNGLVEEMVPAEEAEGKDLVPL